MSIQPTICASRGRGDGWGQRIEIGGGMANAMTSVQKDNIVLLPRILRHYRTDEEKQRRHLHGDSGAKFQSKAIGPAGDQVSNTITTILKDNLLMEKKGITITRDNAEQYGYPIKDDGVIFSHEGKILVYQDGVIFQVRIRKLTPTECFRLMDVDEENIKKIQDAGISKTQQYKMAGNSIVVNVLTKIFHKLFIDRSNESRQLSIFD